MDGVTGRRIGRERETMKAVVTGASGYLGFHLVSELLAAGHTVYAVCNRSRGFLDRIEEKRGLTVMEAEIPKLEEKMNGVVPDVFYHLAWQGALGEQRADASLQISNEILAIEAMKVCSRMGCPKIIFTGTVYEKLAEEMLAAHGFSGNSFYCIAKKHAHDMIRQLSKKLDLRCIWVQFCHPVGKFMNQNQLFPYAVNAFRNNRPAEFGSCRNYFDIVSVRYLSRGLRTLGEKDVPQKTYYIGSGRARILREYLQTAAEHFEYRLPIGFDIRPEDGLTLREEWLDSSEFERDTGMRCEESFEELLDAFADAGKGWN